MPKQNVNTTDSKPTPIPREPVKREIKEAVLPEANRAKRKARVFLPIMPDNPKDDTVVVGHNGKNYIIKRGMSVVVPDFVAEIIENGHNSKYAVIEYL